MDRLPYSMANISNAPRNGADSWVALSFLDYSLANCSRYLLGTQNLYGRAIDPAHLVRAFRDFAGTDIDFVVQWINEFIY